MPIKLGEHAIHPKHQHVNKDRCWVRESPKVSVFMANALSGGHLVLNAYSLPA